MMAEALKTAVTERERGADAAQRTASPLNDSLRLQRLMKMHPGHPIQNMMHNPSPHQCKYKTHQHKSERRIAESPFSTDNCCTEG